MRRSRQQTPTQLAPHRPSAAAAQPATATANCAATSQPLHSPMMVVAPNHGLPIASLAITIVQQFTCHAFAPHFTPRQLKIPSQHKPPAISSTSLYSTNQSPDSPKTPEEDAALQWDLFTRYHAADGEWWGTWTSYDYMGDVIDSTVAG